MEKPLPRLRPMEHLARWVLHAVLDRHPEIFDRLGDYAACRYLIDVKDTPFALLLIPEERDIHVYRRTRKIKADATISGSFMTLIQLVQGNRDGDALFFSRNIEIEGDTEAVLALRNALDDADMDIIHDSLQAMGFWGSPLRLGYRILKEMKPVIAGMFAP